MFRILRRLAGSFRSAETPFAWSPAVDFRDARVTAALRTFNWS